ncbi:hypothetical protein P4159_05960 [Bacillus thuringiensis]|uniref:hypothetical protein n=1 Tax=Bacillus cereus group TaxID=86661 RepID=UPI000CD8F115|nr:MULTISPECIES: hypothetical protein [Bacillus cereus group]MEC3420816.1 hypothetical protein [Bacillus cereus]MEC3596947.1 hypothetical protein [Bacillus thuringiensis]MED1574296.1 hypothetical protein [Bacillus paranthracis]MED1836220.1 hypothetical protein [Bacillus thuringiensis]MED2670283.1 hypothetical protein [Bacillus thuringiensis]
MYTSDGIFTGRHISSLQGATSRPKSHLDEVKDKNQKRIDEISLALIRGEFEVRSAMVTNHLYGLDETKLKITTHGGRNEVEITIKG